MDDANHLGDDVAGALDEHGVADGQSESLDLVFVMQGCARDGDAADEDRLQQGARGHGAGAAYLHVDAFEDRLLLLGLRLEGNGPTRRLGGEAQLTLLRQRVDLDDHAVDFVGQGSAFSEGLRGELQYAVDAGYLLTIGIHLKAQTAERFERFPMRLSDRIGIERVAEEDEITRGGDFGVERPQRTGGGVARIDVGWLFRLESFGIHAVKRAEGHDDFAANLELGPR